MKIQFILSIILIPMYVFPQTISYVLNTNPEKIILDTDLGPDSDDAGALAMLHALATKGETEILAIMCSTKNPWCAPCAAARD